MGTYTSYARRGPMFIRIDVDADDGVAMTKEFLAALSATLPGPEPLPDIVNVLQEAARKPCEAGYHPEDVDYDLEAGPGYTWTGPDGQPCFARLFSSGDEAKAFVVELEEKGIKVTLARGKAAAWSKTDNEKTRAYLEKTLDKVVEAVK